MKHVLASLFAMAAVAAAPFCRAQASPNADPTNPHATPEARALLREIGEISGHYTLTGQHNFPNHLSRWTDRVYDLTGKYPALFGEDFGFAGGDDKDSTEGRPEMIEEVKRQYRNGSVIALCWHAVKPTEDEPVTFRDSVQGHLTDFEWDELLTPGSTLNTRWMAQVDVIAGYLKQLQSAGVPVLFRPYHEMNGNWFWWGGRPGPHGSSELYRRLYDRFVNYHHLNNLVWVWNVNSPGGNAGEVAAYDPGHAFADIYAIDIYGEFKQSYYDEMLALAGNKPVALAEVGTMPTLDVIAQQPRWAYFMMWSGSAEGNPPDLLQANFHAANLLTRGDAALAKYAPAAAPTKGAQIAEPVSRDATIPAKALLAKLYAASGTATFSGQRNAPTPAAAVSSTDGAASTATSVPPASASRSLSAANEQVFAATGKYPTIYATDLPSPDPSGDPRASDSGPATAKAVIAEAKRQFAAGSIVDFRWMPPLPTTGQPDGPDRVLTAFEWNELLTPGTDLNTRWAAQVDAVAASLRQLQDAGIPLIWNPYAESNGKQHWWAGRPGLRGSPELYRMLFDRLVTHDHVGNLIWIWAAAPAGYGPSANGSYFDYYPGLLYTDALVLDINQPQGRGWRSDAMLSTFAVGKLIGVSLRNSVPPPTFFAGTKWAWFVLGPQAGDTPDSTAALKTLYSDTRVMTRSAPAAH